MAEERYGVRGRAFPELYGDVEFEVDDGVWELLDEGWEGEQDAAYGRGGVGEAGSAVVR